MFCVRYWVLIMTCSTSKSGWRRAAMTLLFLHKKTRSQWQWLPLCSQSLFLFVLTCLEVVGIANICLLALATDMADSVTIYRVFNVTTYTSFVSMKVKNSGYFSGYWLNKQKPLTIDSCKLWRIALHTCSCARPESYNRIWAAIFISYNYRITTIVIQGSLYCRCEMVPSA